MTEVLERPDIAEDLEFPLPCASEHCEAEAKYVLITAASCPHVPVLVCPGHKDILLNIQANPPRMFSWGGWRCDACSAMLGAIVRVEAL